MNSKGFRLPRRFDHQRRCLPLGIPDRVGVQKVVEITSCIGAGGITSNEPSLTVPLDLRKAPRRRVTDSDPPQTLPKDRSSCTGRVGDGASCPRDNQDETPGCRIAAFGILRTADVEDGGTTGMMTVGDLTAAFRSVEVERRGVDEEPLESLGVHPVLSLVARRARRLMPGLGAPRSQILQRQTCGRDGLTQCIRHK